MPNQVIVMEDISVDEKRSPKNGFADSHTTEAPAEDTSEWVLHTESCPDGCCRFVSRYLLKTHVEAESSADDCDRPAADLLKAA